ncbi:MAG: hypothetical protein AB7P03_12650 [Kofleriaceae bacterium]
MAFRNDHDAALARVAALEAELERTRDANAALQSQLQAGSRRDSGANADDIDEHLDDSLLALAARRKQVRNAIGLFMAISAAILVYVNVASGTAPLSLRDQISSVIAAACLIVSVPVWWWFRITREHAERLDEIKRRRAGRS